MHVHACWAHIDDVLIRFDFSHAIFARSEPSSMGARVSGCAKRPLLLDLLAVVVCLLESVRMDAYALYFAEAGVSRGFGVLLRFGLPFQHAVAFKAFECESVDVGELPGRFGLVRQLLGLAKDGLVFDGEHRSSRSTLFCVRKLSE